MFFDWDNIFQLPDKLIAKGTQKAEYLLAKATTRRNPLKPIE